MSETRCCPRCEEDLPISAFKKSNARDGERHKLCRSCENKGLTTVWEWKRCKYCGVALPDGLDHDVCKPCALKAIKWTHGLWYVVIEDPTPNHPFKGGHFRKEDVEAMLDEGCGVEGMVLELWFNKRYQQRVRIVGPEGMVQMQEPIEEPYTPKGDGVFLTPGEQHASHQ